MSRGSSAAVVLKLTPYLHSGVHVVVDVIVLQHPVAVVIEIHAHLTQEVDSRETITTWMRKERTHLWYRVPFIEPQRTCLPLWMRLRRRTGVLPVVTHTPASVLL